MTWGIWEKIPFRQMIHAPNVMQLSELSETPKNEMQQENFDLWWRDEDINSNIGSNGDGSSLEVPRTTNFWESRQCLRPLGYGVHNFNKSTQDSWLILLTENWLKPTQFWNQNGWKNWLEKIKPKLKSIFRVIAFTSGPKLKKRS